MLQHGGKVFHLTLITKLQRKILNRADELIGSPYPLPYMDHHPIVR